MIPPRVLFYVQYLEGIGHLVRAKRIAQELIKRGGKVSLVLGGNPIPGFEVTGVTIHQLPPLMASPDSYSNLLTADGVPADSVYKAARRDQLLAIYDAEVPDVLITEAYPMGRWAMHFELEPLLARAHTERGDGLIHSIVRRPMIVASLRDILQMPKRAEKAAKSIELFETYYDHMLVHGDPELVRIDESFPPLTHLLERAHYTGIVAPEVSEGGRAGESRETFDVIVSGGGGAIGYEVLAAAIGAKPSTSLAAGRWLALAGPLMPEANFDRLSALAASHDVRLERFRTGLTGLMTRAQLSIQRAGYNTVADLLVAGCRAVLVPDAAGGQMEQPTRGARLAALGRVVVVAEADLSPDTLASGIDAAMTMSLGGLSFDLDGAAKSAEIICELHRVYEGAQDGIKLS